MKSKLLLDANLSWRSIDVLKEHFDDCCHVDKIGLIKPARDYDIWEYAKYHNLIIITNDEDFLDLSIIKGFPPKVILLKTGNQSRKVVEQTIISSKSQILEFINYSEFGVLELILRENMYYTRYNV
jgi:predicted nuclease of predicted toxin-antitoxin system